MSLNLSDVVVNVMLIPIMRGSKAISQNPLWQQQNTVVFATTFNTTEQHWNGVFQISIVLPCVALTVLKSVAGKRAATE